MCTSRTSHRGHRRSPRWSTLLILLALTSCAGRGGRITEPLRPEAPSGFFAQPKPRPLSERSSSELGGRLYAALCASCHGAGGRAETPLARDLDPAPRDFTSCNFKYRSTPSGSLPLEGDLWRTITVGLPGSAMPALGRGLGSVALRALGAEVIVRCARFSEEEAEPPLHLPEPPLYTQESVSHGRAVYVREGCASCHGERGRGDGPAAATLRELSGRPVRPRDYTRGVYRSGFQRRDLYRAFSTGLDGTPMPALPATVSASDRWDLTSYLVSLSESRSRLLRALESTPSWYEPVRAWGIQWR